MNMARADQEEHPLDDDEDIETIEVTEETDSQQEKN